MLLERKLLQSKNYRLLSFVSVLTGHTMSAVKRFKPRAAKSTEQLVNGERGCCVEVEMHTNLIQRAYVLFRADWFCRVF